MFQFIRLFPLTGPRSSKDDLFRAIMLFPGQALEMAECPSHRNNGNTVFFSQPGNKLSGHHQGFLLARASDFLLLMAAWSGSVLKIPPWKPAQYLPIQGCHLASAAEPHEPGWEVPQGHPLLRHKATHRNNHMSRTNAVPDGSTVLFLPAVSTSTPNASVLRCITSSAWHPMEPSI